jgi:beta-lactamase regulating signal transducer with metallopeptidase domain
MSDLAIALRVASAQVESFGGALVQRVGALNVWTGALFAGALLLDRALARRTRASWRIALYAPVAARVLLPLDWSFGIAPSPAVDAFVAPVARISAGAAGLGAAHPSWHSVLAVVDVVVMAALALHAVVARVRLARALEGARPTRAIVFGAPCPVLEHDELGPMVVGLFAPRIVLPSRLLASGEEHALACVLRHEAAHLRRGDAWLSLVMQVLTVVAWPVAPLWLAAARVRRLIELACDEAALEGADASERRRYGHALLDMAEWRPLAVVPIAAGELHFGSSLRARIEALASQRQWPITAQRLFLFVAPLALFAACSGASSAPAAPAGDTGYGYQFEFDPAKGAPPAPPAPSLATTNADGRIPPETIQAAVRSHFTDLQRCYEAGLQKNAKLAGTVSVKYVFGEDGVTKDASDEGSTIPDKDVVSCVVGEFRKIAYPVGRGGDVTVVYPVVFSP